MISHYEGSDKSAWFEIKWYTSAYGFYADDVNILGGSLYAIKKNTDTLVVASREIGLEVNADKPKYMVMS
jgi:hypothetical protein